MGEDNPQQSVQVSGFGKGIKVSGPSAFLACLVTLLLCVMAYLVDFNLRTWGEPFPVKLYLEDHVRKMDHQHEALALALRWNTYVQWTCSSNNLNADARMKCSRIDLMKPEQETDNIRRYRIPKEQE